MQDREYGARALIGIAVPQANPTVEPEMTVLMPQGVSMVAARMTSGCSDPRERLIEYERELPATLACFDTLRLDAVGFACTGASYLLGVAAEDARLAEHGYKHGYPVVSAAQAIKAALQHLNVRRLALLSPYPAWLNDASHAYWGEQGIEIVKEEFITLPSSDTRGVYAIRNPAVLAASVPFAGCGAEALLLSGTGMPTLRALAPLERQLGIPVLSSNYCLAWALLDRLGILPPRVAGAPLLTGWQTRLERL